ncbi:hypothetical protein PFISCL1PPCAC_5720, partial [Pristionchus fissidentatus]
QMDSSPFSESDDSMSESTRAFNLKMEKDFIKAFPLRSETKVSMGPPSSTVKGNPGFGKTPLFRGNVAASTPMSMKTLSAPTPIKFSLDDSFVTGAAAQNLSSKVAELSTELDLHKRKLDRQTKELAAASERIEKYKADAEELLRGNGELKKQKQQLEEELRGEKLTRESSSSSSLAAVSSTLIDKAFTWLEWKEAQLYTMGTILANAGLWTEKERTVIGNSYRMIEPKTFSPDEILLFAGGSVQEFTGIHDMEFSNDEQRAEVEDEDGVEEEVNPNDTTIRDVNDSIYMDESQTGGKEVSMNESSLILEGVDDHEDICQSELDASVLDCTLHEKDEQIERLEYQLNMAREQLENFRGRTTRLAVVDEENANLKHRLACLEGINDDAIRDLHASKRMCEEQIVSLNSPQEIGRTEREGARALNQKMMNMQRRINDLEEEVRKVRGEMEIVNVNGQRAMNEAEKERKQREEMEKNAQFMMNENAGLVGKLHEVEQKLTEAEARNAEPSIRLVDETVVNENPSTDAGDTTQILHFNFNPLQQARQELKEEQERKRSMDGSEGPCVKRSKSEEDAEMENLKKRLQESELRVEKLAKINTEISHKFRHNVLKTTGFEVKMKSDECVQVMSFLDPLKQHFGFMLRDNLVEMIELVDKPFTGPDRFTQETHTWLAERGSVPGFLSAVQLKLLAETMVEPEETLMFGDEEFDPAGPSFSILRED